VHALRDYLISTSLELDQRALGLHQEIEAIHWFRLGLNQLDFRCIALAPQKFRS
jgi:hypothetical protein